MISTNVKLIVKDFLEDITYGYRNLYIDKLGRCFVKVKGHYRSLPHSYSYYEERGYCFISLNSGYSS